MRTNVQSISERNEPTFAQSSDFDRQIVHLPCRFRRIDTGILSARIVCQMMEAEGVTADLK